MSPTPERKRPAQPVKTQAWARAQKAKAKTKKSKDKPAGEPGIVDRVIDKVTKKGGKS